MTREDPLLSAALAWTILTSCDARPRVWLSRSGMEKFSPRSPLVSKSSLNSIKMIALIILQYLLHVCKLVDAIVPPDPMITAAAQLVIRDNGANVIGYELDGAICGFSGVFSCQSLNHVREPEIMCSWLVFNFGYVGKL